MMKNFQHNTNILGNYLLILNFEYHISNVIGVWELIRAGKLMVNKAQMWVRYVGKMIWRLVQFFPRHFICIVTNCDRNATVAFSTRTKQNKQAPRAFAEKTASFSRRSSSWRALGPPCPLFGLYMINSKSPFDLFRRKKRTRLLALPETWWRTFQ